jgi:signal peptidase I
MHIESLATTYPTFDWRRVCFGTNPKRTLARILVWGAVSLLFFHHLLLPIKIIGSSMYPTYRDGSVNFINRMAYARSFPRRGDVIALRRTDEVLLKRIVALPGEQVSIVRGTIRINGRPLADRFATSKVLSEEEEMAPIRLNQREYFVIGDNRETSFYGKISLVQILGKIVF